jgi:UDP-N-acetylglucosamine 1-carboxyvinyltransferase
MDKIRVTGGDKLFGNVDISGSKNAALPIFAATLLTSEECVIKNVPILRDITSILELLSDLGAEYSYLDPHTVKIQTKDIKENKAQYDLVRKMRASFFVLGPLLARHGNAIVSRPGGCAIGARPVDLHIKALKDVGYDVSEEHGYVLGKGRINEDCTVYFQTVTVGGTENLIMASALSNSTVTIKNAAQEPEIVALSDFLNLMGAHIDGAGTETIIVKGNSVLHGSEFDVIPDRIEAGSYLFAVAVTRGEVVINKCNPKHIGCVVDILRESGFVLEVGNDYVKIFPNGHIKPLNIKTSPYPNFPTDLQAPLMVFLTQANGVSIITETIFENRFTHVPELQRMGADIKTEGNIAIINGPKNLFGAQVMATDLRASVSLILAGLVAKDETIISRVYHLDRGYERIEEKLALLGAKIMRIKD